AFCRFVESAGARECGSLGSKLVFPIQPTRAFVDTHQVWRACPAIRRLERAGLGQFSRWPLVSLPRGQSQVSLIAQTSQICRKLSTNMNFFLCRNATLTLPW